MFLSDVSLASLSPPLDPRYGEVPSVGVTTSPYSLSHPLTQAVIVSEMSRSGGRDGDRREGQGGMKVGEVG